MIQIACFKPWFNPNLPLPKLHAAKRLEIDGQRVERAVDPLSFVAPAVFHQALHHIIAIPIQELGKDVDVCWLGQNEGKTRCVFKGAKQEFQTPHLQNHIDNTEIDNNSIPIPAARQNRFKERPACGSSFRIRDLKQRLVTTSH